MADERIIGFIPARYASQRLPGKALADIAGLPMIVRVMQGAGQASLLDRLIVLTDDERILRAVEIHGGEAMMTPEWCRNGSERIAWALKSLPCSIAVNVQGDEPLITGELVDLAINPLLEERRVDFATLACQIRDMTELNNPSAVKVVCDIDGNALYFSRSPLPYPADFAPGDKNAPYLKHIGLYGCRAEALKKTTAAKPTPLEKVEKLEQLRMLEMGFRIKVVVVEHELIGVDTAEDLEKVRKRFSYNNS